MVIVRLKFNAKKFGEEIEAERKLSSYDDDEFSFQKMYELAGVGDE